MADRAVGVHTPRPIVSYTQTKKTPVTVGLVRPDRPAAPALSLPQTGPLSVRTMSGGYESTYKR